jgi:hypothetical protein
LDKLKNRVFNKSDDETFQFIDLESVKQTPTSEQLKLEDDKTIQVIDIPLGVKTPIIRSTFERFGNITRLTTQTRGMHQHAFITYETQQMVQPFFDSIWSVFILKDCVRVLPKTLPQQARDLRREHCIKISGLPYGTCAHDLHHILRDTKAKSCFIPRKRNNYNYCNYAFLTFVDDDILQNAISQNYAIKNYELFWTSPDAKTCHMCGSPGHLVKECPSKQQQIEKSQRDKQLEKLYNRYRPAQHRKPRSYAAAAANNVNNNKNKNENSNNVKNSILDDFSEDEFNILNTALITLQNGVTKLAENIASLSSRIDALEKDKKASTVKSSNNQSQNSNNKGKDKNVDKSQQSQKPPKRSHDEVSASSSDEESESKHAKLREEQKQHGIQIQGIQNQLQQILGFLNEKTGSQSTSEGSSNSHDDEKSVPDLMVL